MPKVSVIVTCYNYGRYLKQCLDSVREQMFTDYELIVIDDGSEDDSLDVALDSYADKVIRHKNRLGVVTTNNEGVGLSRGEYVCFVNADDHINPAYLARCVEALDAHADTAIAYTDFWHFGKLDNGVQFPEFTLSGLKSWNFILGSAMFRRCAYDEVGGFAEEMSVGMEDYDLWLSICERGWKAIRIPEYLYYYRAHEKNRTNKMDMTLATATLWRKHGMFERIAKEMPYAELPPKTDTIRVTATVSTKGRYFSTLPLVIEAICLQTYKPEHLIIYDDGEHKDLREDPLYQNLLPFISQSGISWDVVWAPGKGQVFNHEQARKNARTEFIWRLDDDNVPMPNVLEELVKCMTDGVGAVGGVVIDPKQLIPPSDCRNKIEEIYDGRNLQWFFHKGVHEVDHLYSTFLYRKEAAKHGYCQHLSQVGHREETIFTHEIKLGGWALLVNPEALTWHLRNAQGGIRSNPDQSLWQHDEVVFARKLTQWGVKPRETKLCVLDNGVGDHYIFKQMLPELKEKHKDKRIVLALCYPEVFEGETGFEIISIADAKKELGDKFEDTNVYAHCWVTNWKGPVLDAFREFYL
jgi:glycosyltransferase involved in cell wall biosynthesis